MNSTEINQIFVWQCGYWNVYFDNLETLLLFAKLSVAKGYVCLNYDKVSCYFSTFGSLKFFNFVSTSFSHTWDSSLNKSRTFESQYLPSISCFIGLAKVDFHMKLLHKQIFNKRCLSKQTFSSGKYWYNLWSTGFIISWHTLNTRESRAKPLKKATKEDTIHAKKLIKFMIISCNSFVELDPLNSMQLLIIFLLFIDMIYSLLYVCFWSNFNCSSNCFSANRNWFTAFRDISSQFKNFNFLLLCYIINCVLLLFNYVDFFAHFHLLLSYI